MTTLTTTATTPSALNSTPDSSTDIPLDFKSFNDAKSFFNLDFTLKFNMTFVDDLNDPQSAQYKNTAQNFTAMLTPVYQQIPSFKQIDIVDLVPGSIIVLYTTQFSLSSNDNVTEMLKSSQAPLSQLPNVDSEYLAYNYPLQMRMAASTISEILNDSCRAVGICDPGYTCRADLKKCVHKCVDYTCSQNAECFLNEYDLPQCRCKQSEKYVYSGPNCSIVQERLSLGSTEIIALGVSVGLAAIIVAVILTLTIIRCRRRRKQAADEQSNFVTSEFEDNSTPWSGPDPLRLALSGNEIHRDRRTSSAYNRNHTLLPDNDDRLRELGTQDVIYIPDPVYPGRRDQLSRTDPHFRFSEADLSERKPTLRKAREDSPRESAQLRIHTTEP
ncbi:unnamed protein product [Lymnaea stagnalis]|uniref:SEA domain-containing protein n=1 Tax=Lymnaea stagnalis TaxID=6523 RepID=A0AAV2GXI1_LYMST